jgi:hypothetical protein
MQPQKCDLLGYLLGALDANEQQQIDRELEKNPHLEAELMRLKETLRPVEDLRSYEDKKISLDSRRNLGERTCHLVASVPLEKRLASNFETADRKGSVEQRIPVDFGPIRSSWSISDFIALAVCLAVISAIVVPAISFSRYESRLTACKDNLTRIGSALADYQSAHDMIIPVSYRGNRGVAGIYAPTLRDGGFIDENESFRCPGRGSCDDTEFACIPTLAEIDQANCTQIREMHRKMGGDYSYVLGYMSDGVYHNKRKLGRPCLVVLADNACPNLSGRASSYHACEGQNVLFGDGSVRFVSIKITDPCFDVIYQNDNGITAAGIGPNDNVVGPSYARPLPFCQKEVMTTFDD